MSVIANAAVSARNKTVMGNSGAWSGAGQNFSQTQQDNLSNLRMQKEMGWWGRYFWHYVGQEQDSKSLLKLLLVLQKPP